MEVAGAARRYHLCNTSSFWAAHPCPSFWHAWHPLGIWSEADELPLAFFVPVTLFWKAVATDARTVVAAQIGLFIPILVWILVTFRHAEMIGVFAPHFVPLIPMDRKKLERRGGSIS